jgi:eukaryotic-like serine/threonine-protein kinase
MRKICPVSKDHVNRDEANFCCKCGHKLEGVKTEEKKPVPGRSNVLSNGTVLQKRYRILGLLGQGGMGAVYKAEDSNLAGKVCAVKEMRPDGKSDVKAVALARQQFKKEANTLANLSHPNLPRVTDYFTENSNEYLVMDFVQGEDLDTLVEKNKGPLDEAQVLAWTLQLCDMLDYVHKRNIVHRDIKPANIILNASGQVLLVDFGLVKLMDPNNPNTVLIIRGKGTPAYAPPEQYEQVAGHTDQRSDIYSLGATLYTLLTGVPPLDSIKRLDPKAPLKTPTSLNNKLSSEFEAVVLKAMQVKIDQRYQNAAEMKEAVSRIKPGKGKKWQPNWLKH